MSSGALVSSQTPVTTLPMQVLHYQNLESMRQSTSYQHVLNGFMFLIIQITCKTILQLVHGPIMILGRPPCKEYTYLGWFQSLVLIDTYHHDGEANKALHAKNGHDLPSIVHHYTRISSWYRFRWLYASASHNMMNSHMAFASR
jgi:hypothetical protein